MIQYKSLVILFVVHHTIGSVVFNCPANRIKFEKFIGLRPSIYYHNRVLYLGARNSPVTLDCIAKCSQDDKCMSFLLYYNSSTCYSYENESVIIQNYDYDSKPDTNIVWFRKTCVQVPKSCESKAWTFEIISGVVFIGFNTKYIKGTVTRRQCMNYCLTETTFQCRSAKFKAIDPSDIDPAGECVLSSMDRHLIPNAFRVSKYENEYIENECVNSTNTKEFCNYEEYDNTRLENADLYFTNFDQHQCQMMCESIHAFNCRGYSSVPSASDSNTHSCLLHSEDSKLIGPKLLIDENGAKYYEKARCINITVSCVGQKFIVKYTPEQIFNGKMYAQGYFDTNPCYAEGHRNDTLTLEIPLENHKCGAIKAHSTGSINRTLVSMYLVIQYNPLIQTQGDRLLKIECIDDNTDQVILDTNVNFTDSYPNKGSTVFNTSTILPVITMRVVDFNTKNPTHDTEIGQELQLIIEIKPGDGPYDIWASNLAASSENGYNSLALIDDRGCPVDISIFPPFVKVVTNSSRSLIATFQAFKFSTSPVVRFRVMVHFCAMRCPEPQCNDNEINQRQKRSSQTDNLAQLTDDSINATVHKVNGKNNENKYIEEIPLDIILVVRTSKSATDKFVIGENNKILVAGYDIVTDEVCIDYNLFVGLIVVWILLQVIILVACYLLIKRYKKYFDIAYTRQLDDMQQNFGLGHGNPNRRVRWADQ